MLKSIAPTLLLVLCIIKLSLISTIFLTSPLYTIFPSLLKILVSLFLVALKKSNEFIFSILSYSPGRISYPALLITPAFSSNFTIYAVFLSSTIGSTDLYSVGTI